MNKFVEWLKKYWPTFMLFFLLIVAYGFLTKTGVLDPFLFPTPGKIKDSFTGNPKVFLLNILASFKLLFPSLIMAIFLAVLLGVPLGLNRRARDVFLPVVYSLSVIPAILLSPFLLILAPSLEWASRIMIIYSVMWPTCFGVINGLATISRGYLDTADTLEITGIKRLTRILLPAASPTILTGFISSLRGSFTILVFAEMYGAKHGLGYFVKKNADFGLYDNVWSGFICLVVVLVTALRIFEAVKDRALAWTIDQ